jgi:hypothetical protein
MIYFLSCRQQIKHVLERLELLHHLVFAILRLALYKVWGTRQLLSRVMPSDVI